MSENATHKSKRNGVASQMPSVVPRMALSLSEFADEIGVSQTFLRYEIARKKLHPTRLGRRVLISMDEARRYLVTHTSAG